MIMNNQLNSKEFSKLIPVSGNSFDALNTAQQEAVTAIKASLSEGYHKTYSFIVTQN